MPEWAEKFFRLPRKGSPEPGRYTVSRAEFGREIMEKLSDDHTQEVVFVKGGQISGSTLARIAVGYWTDTRATDKLLVLPDEKTAKEHLTDRIQPLFDLQRLKRWNTANSFDVSKQAINLLHCGIKLGFSGSPQSLASRSIGEAVYDETDKAQEHAKEAATLDLVRVRLLTYGARSKLFCLSTPTVISGPIWQAYTEVTDKRRYHVPCPCCGEHQALEWAWVRWDDRDEEDPDKILRVADALLSGTRRAWYECPSCNGRIEESTRQGAVQKGHWVSCLPPEEAEVSVRIAYQISSLYSPWVSLARTVVEFLRCRAARDMRSFYNSYMGLPNEESTSRPDASILEQRAGAHPAFIVPDWCTALVAGADTQARDGKPYWYWIVKAWGPYLRSRTIAWGMAYSPGDLMAATVDAEFPTEDGRHTVSPLIVCVDSGGAVDLEDYEDGSTTQLVYRMAREDPARVVPVKGAALRRGAARKQDKLITAKNVDYAPHGDPLCKILLHTIDTETLKDQMTSLISEVDPVLWEESAASDKTYLSHMTTEEKTRTKIGRRFEVRWVNNTRRRNDLLDATIYSLAGAHMVKAEQRRDHNAERKHLAEELKQHSPAARHETGRERQREPRTKRGGGSWISRRER